MTLDVLVVTGGHLFEADPFFAVFDAIDDAVEDIAWTAAGAPTTGHDVVVFYDMPGGRPQRRLGASSGERPVLADQTNVHSSWASSSSSSTSVSRSWMLTSS